MRELIIVCDDEADETGGVKVHMNFPLVRCQDCQHWTRALGGQCNRFTVNDIAHCTSPDWFCADGERRTE